MNIKSKYIDWTLYTISGVSPILSLLISRDILPKEYFLGAIIFMVLSITVTVIWKIYGSGKREKKQAYEIIKDVLNKDSKNFSKNNVEVRINLMMVKRKKGWCFCEKNLRIVCYSDNMEHDKDRILEFEKWMGCAGQAWAMKHPIAANITREENSTLGGPQWFLPPEFTELTKDLKAIVSVPVEHVDTTDIIGVVNFDSKNDDAKEHLLNEGKITTMKTIALFISQTLHKLDQY